MKTFLLLTLLISFLLLLALPELLLAQPPGFPEDPPQVPIDGGLGILVAAGGAYALNKLRKEKVK